MIKFQSLPRQKRRAIRDEVLRMYAETDMSYGEIAEVNGVQSRTVEYIIRNFASELPETPVMRKKRRQRRRLQRASGRDNSSEGRTATYLTAMASRYGADAGCVPLTCVTIIRRIQILSRKLYRHVSARLSSEISHISPLRAPMASEDSVT